MPFVKGQTGNPGGQQKDRQFADALRLVVNRDEVDGKKKLLKIAEKLVECAIAGDSWAVAQVADRLDGRPAQESTINVNSKSLTELADAEIAARIEQLRAGRAGAVRGDDEASFDPSQLN
jgi:hypothetical protein